MDWIDLFTRNEYKDILLKSWQHCCEQKGLEVYAWVIMTNHVHMIIGSNKNPCKAQEAKAQNPRLIPAPDLLLFNHYILAPLGGKESFIFKQIF